MFKTENCKGADISTTLCGIKLRTPYILTSGPLSYAAEGLIRAHQAGCGAVVTKTIRLARAINPANHIGRLGETSLINCEKWADSDPDLWYNREIPMTKAAGAVVIGSVGHTPQEARAIVEDVERAGADIIELVSYAEETLLPMLEFTRDHVKIPIICKLSANWPDPVGTAIRCIERGAAGICAIDSIGPTLKIDIKNARPEMMGAGGYGWMSGEAIRPISLRINSEIARQKPGFENLYGSGGCMSAEHAVEFLMVGCNSVGVCSVGIIRDVEYIEQMCYDLSKLLKKLGYNNLDEVRGKALDKFPTKDIVSVLGFNYQPYYAPCQEACPAGVNVPQYVDEVRRGRYTDAYNTVSVTNPLPSICGRVCDHPCEAQCRRGETDEPIQIRLLKRTASDKTHEAFGDNLPIPLCKPSNGKKVAIVGSGPAGLSAAYYLAKQGYGVKIFESLPVAGGMLAVGIPDYRLPKDTLQSEIRRIERMGVEIRTGVTIGKDFTLGDLREQGFDSILLATGAHGDPAVDMPGKEFAISGIKFLRDVNLGQAASLNGKKVVVIGGGNVAVDAARCARRIGAADVTIAYRRTRDEMPAYAEEVAHAEEEGVKILFLAAPAKVEEGALFYSPMKLGEPDASGRRKPVASGEADVKISADVVILATGQKIVEGLIPAKNASAHFKYKTVENDVYYAGDCYTGPASVIKAIAAGRDAAAEIDLSLGGSGKVMDPEKVCSLRLSPIAHDHIARKQPEYICKECRVPGFSEVELGLRENDARDEAERCLKCGCINCQRCVAVCSYDARKLEFPIMTVDEKECRSCGACVSVCPTGALTGFVKPQTDDDRAREAESIAFYAQFSSGH
ncbi:MAG: FAD-dependent oxidoreductase [Bacillota bacterium]